MSSQYTDPEILARRLDQALPPDSGYLPPQTPDPLVNTAAAVARMQVPELRADALVRIETRMFAALDAQTPPLRALPKRRRSPYTLLRYASVASLILVLFIMSLAPSVASSLPTQPLYFVKQTIERAELALARDDASRAQVLVTQAERRAEEALALLDNGAFTPTLVESAVASVSEASPQAILSSASLRAQTGQAAYLLNFVLLEAEAQTLVEAETVNQLSEEVNVLTRLSEGIPPTPPTDDPAEVGGAGDAPAAASDTPSPSPTATHTLTPSPTMTATTSATPTPSATMTATSTATVTPSRTLTRTPRPTRTRRATNTPQPTNTIRPTNTPRPPVANQATDCPGTSCESQGVPGGNVIPNTPQGNQGGGGSGGGSGSPPNDPGGGGSSNPPNDPGGGGNANPPANPGGGGSPPENPGGGSNNNPPGNSGGGNSDNNGGGGGRP